MDAYKPPIFGWRGDEVELFVPPVRLGMAHNVQDDPDIRRGWMNHFNEALGVGCTILLFASRCRTVIRNELCYAFL